MKLPFLSRPGRRPGTFPICSLVAAGVLAAAGALAAPPASFESVGAGGGGAMFSPSFSPHNTNEMFASCDMSPFFHTTNMGQNWTTINYAEIQGNRGSKAQFTNNPNILYCLDYSVVDGSDLVRPSKSLDGGVTWTPIASDPTDGGSGGAAIHLFADPGNANRVIVTDYSTLYYSNNGGTSWNNRYTAATGSGIHAGGAFWDGSNIFVGTNDGLLVSTNGGTSFAIQSVGGFPAGRGIASFSGAKEGSSVRLWALSASTGDLYGGLTVEDLYGLTQDIHLLDWDGTPAWVNADTGLPNATDGIALIAGPLNDIDVLWAAGGNGNEEPTIHRTTNGGGSWTSVLNRTASQNVNTGWMGFQGDRQYSYCTGATGLAVHPTDGNRAAWTDYGFLHYTTNGGTMWNQAYVTTATQNPSGAATPKREYYGGTGLENTSCWWMYWSDANNVFAGYSDTKGIRSKDGGNTWGYDYTGHTLNTGYHIVRHAASNTLYMGASSAHDMYQSTYLQDNRIDGATGQIVMSSNNGDSWTEMHNFGDPVMWLAIDPNNPNTMYATTAHSSTGGVYRTTNRQNGNTSTWTKLANPPRTEGHAFNIHVLNDGSLVATYSGRRNAGGTFTASSGVFTLPAGATPSTSWTDVSHSGMLYWTKDLIIDPNDPTQNTWYVGVFSGWGGPPNGLGGLYRTTNRGTNWTRIFAPDRCTSMAIDPNNPNEAYATTEGEGLWYTANLGSATPAFTQLTSYPFRQPERVLFNPFDSHEVWVTSFGSGIRRGRTEAPSGAPSGFMISINEVDMDQGADPDLTEFVELYNPSNQTVDLGAEQYSLVFYNGGAANDPSYRALDVTGTIPAGGFHVVGNMAGADQLLGVTSFAQDGADAVALFRGAAAAAFPNGSAVTFRPAGAQLVDAVVYDSNDADDSGLLSLLLPGQPQRNESDLDADEAYSLQRCPDGAGGPRRNSVFVTGVPTPGISNNMGCPADTDLDGLPDTCETLDTAALAEAGSQQTNAWLPDSDGDGLLDGEELQLCQGTALQLAATSARDRDHDNDGWRDGLEFGRTTTFPGGPLTPNGGLIDVDGDGVPSSIDPNDGNDDTDGDRYSDAYELANGGNPSSATSIPPLGDVTLNGIVDLADVSAASDSNLGITIMPGYRNCDLNSDAIFDLLDVSMLADCNLGLLMVP